MFSRLKVERGELAVFNSAVDVRLEIMAIKSTTGLSKLISTPGLIQGSYLTCIQKQISRTFPGLFQDSNWFFKGSKIHIKPLHFQDLNVNSPYCLPYTSYFLDEFHRFPELSRTSDIFPELSSPGKCHNKTPGLSRFSRTHTNPVGCHRSISAISLKDLLSDLSVQFDGKSWQPTV